MDDRLADFNPRGLRRPRHICPSGSRSTGIFQSTRPSQTSTIFRYSFTSFTYYFNPRGLRRPRQQKCSIKSISFQHIYTNIILFHYIPPSPLLNNLPFYRHSSIILVRICWGIYVHLGFAPERIDRLIPIAALKEYPLNPVRL